MPFFKKKYRDISPTEFSYQARDTKAESPFINQFFVEGIGEITKTQLESAVAKAAGSNPGITLKWRGKWFWRYWEKDQKLPEIIEYKGAWQGQNSANFDSLSKPMDVRSDVLSTITIIKLNPQHFNKKNRLKTHERQTTECNVILLFRIHHSICDGMGTLHWIQEVFRALRHENLSGSVSHINELTIVQREEYSPNEYDLQKSKPVFATSQNPEKTGCHWVKNRWEVSDTKIIPKLIFILKTIAEEQHKTNEKAATTKFRIPADLRHYLSKKEKQQNHLSNLSGIIDLSFTEKDNVNDIYKALIKAIRNKKDMSAFPKKILKYTKLLPKALLTPNPKFISAMHSQGVCNMTGMLTHIGKVSLEQYSYNTFEAQGIYGIPIPIEDKSIFIGVFSDGKAIYSVISAPNALSTIESTQKLANNIEKHLHDL